MEKGFKGISYPFRFDSRGGVATSTTSMNDFTHINEGVEQAIATSINDRIMEISFGSELKDYIFSLNNDASQASACLVITEALAKDSRIKVLNVQAYEEDLPEGNAIAVDVIFEVVKYRKTTSTKVVINKEGM